MGLTSRPDKRSRLHGNGNPYPADNGLDLRLTHQEQEPNGIGFYMQAYEPSIPSALSFLFDGSPWGCVKGRKILKVFPSHAAGFWHTSQIDLEERAEVQSVKPMKPFLVCHFATENGFLATDAWRVTDFSPVLFSAKKPRAREHSTPSVYFIGAGDFVKIGWAIDPTKRVKELQTGCPHELTILATLHGTQVEEFELHRRFAAYRVRHNGEWFHATPELLSFISEITA